MSPASSAAMTLRFIAAVDVPAETIGTKVRRLIASFLGRRAELQAESDAQLLAGRWSHVRFTELSWRNGPKARTQPRRGNGRFLSKAWLKQAETFTTADLSWFRSPVSEGR